MDHEFDRAMLSCLSWSLYQPASTARRTVDNSDDPNPFKRLTYVPLSAEDCGRTVLTGEITALRAPRPGEASPEAVHSFRFDQVGDAGTDQAAVFEAVGRPISDAALAGFNATVFAFGQTGAGKSYTMFGAEHGAQRGLAPRMLEQLLARVERGCRCRCTAVEIHNETLSDLLAPGAKPPAERERHAPG